MNLFPDSKFGERSRFAILYSPLAVWRITALLSLLGIAYNWNMPTDGVPFFPFLWDDPNTNTRAIPHRTPIINDFKSSIVTPFLIVKGFGQLKQNEH